MVCNFKTMVLASGSEEGANWKLKSNVCARMESFAGSFQVHNQEQVRRDRIRNKDRKWFKRHLGNCFMCDQQVHHDWKNGETFYIVSKK